MRKPMIRTRLSEKALRQPTRLDWLVAAVFGVCVSPVGELILRGHPPLSRYVQVVSYKHTGSLHVDNTQA
jgi:multisubunit Na+/H+ antiporter MnhB subunit